MVPKRRMPLNGSNSIKRRKTTLKPVEEVVFDTAAREDFLSGFHKRKLARARHAQEAAAKKERARRIEARRLLREGRKRDVEKHTEAVNEALASLEKKREGEEAWSGSESGKEEWQGIQEPEKFEYEDEYSDEDRHTVVTVEEVDASRQGLRRIAGDSDETSESDEESDNPEVYNGHAPFSDQPQDANGKPEVKYAQKKKTNFRYESKAARKYKKSKERTGKRFGSKNKRPRKP